MKQKSPDSCPFTIITVRRQLQEMSEPSYSKFVSSLTPGAEHVIGVRLPLLRVLARRIVVGDWRKFLAENPLFYFEEKMLQGFVIRYASCTIEEKLSFIREFVPLIDNWSICDSFCWKLKIKERKDLWKFLLPYFHSTQEFEIRFAVVMALRNFIDEDYLFDLFSLLENVCTDEYYARMGVAWIISVCYIKYPQKTLTFLSNARLDNDTYNKSLQKILESFQVTKDEKIKIRMMKRK